jgi:hypothetical protein
LFLLKAVPDSYKWDTQSSITSSKWWSKLENSSGKLLIGKSSGSGGNSLRLPKNDIEEQAVQYLPAFLMLEKRWKQFLGMPNYRRKLIQPLFYLIVVVTRSMTQLSGVVDCRKFDNS